MQGQLWRRFLRATIESACAHCGQPLTLEVDSAVHAVCRTAGAAPLVFMPDVDWASFAEPTILDAY
ncbi:MAG: hypothetical protein HZB53_09100 [Chloroflexi bacterium]|nr:hypothetical protein [Chloroflexota bacterium]